MDKNSAKELLMGRGHDEIGADTIISDLEESGELEGMDADELTFYSQNYYED